MIKAGIIGGTGYTGVELLRLLSLHPYTEVKTVISRQHAGQKIADIFTGLRGHCNLAFESPDNNSLSDCEVVFSATPNGVAMKHVKAILDKGIRFIDLSADFRLKDIQIWEKWYGLSHTCPELLKEAVYGLPEVNRELIRTARLIACPGCYPTASLLALIPLLKNNLVNNDIIIDAKSGVSGAGKKESIDYLFSETGESIKAYGLEGHRHLPEILQELSRFSHKKLSLTFVPHLIPMIRGILVTCYADLLDNSIDLQDIYESFYKNEPFVDVLPAGVCPQTRSVKGSNNCCLAVFKPQNGNKVIVLGVEDNLVKGAAGQAVQCMNICCDLPETSGLDLIALVP